MTIQLTKIDQLTDLSIEAIFGMERGHFPYRARSFCRPVSIERGHFELWSKAILNRARFARRGAENLRTYLVTFSLTNMVNKKVTFVKVNEAPVKVNATSLFVNLNKACVKVNA